MTPFSPTAHISDALLPPMPHRFREVSGKISFQVMPSQRRMEPGVVTAQTLVLLVPQMPVICLPFGEATGLQERPFQRKNCPMAPVQISLGPLPQMLISTPVVAGAATVVHAVPFQRTMVLAAPVAQTLVEPVPQTA